MKSDILKTWNALPKLGLAYVGYDLGLTLPLRRRPKIFAVEVTNYCNLRCIMCPYENMKRKREHMDVELFKKIIDEIKDYQLYQPHGAHIRLENFGEPLLHPRLEELLSYCRKAGVEVGFSTNATLLTEERIKYIIRSEVNHIVFAFDGATKETYEKMRPPASFEETKQNILNFLEIKEKLGLRRPKTKIQLIMTTETVREIEEFKMQWNGKVDEVDVVKMVTWANQVENVLPLAGERGKYLCDFYFKRQKRRGPCFLLWDQVIILSNGEIVPCCLDFDGLLSLGNVRDESIVSIFNGSKIRQLRKDHLNGKFPKPCSTCPEKHYGWISKEGAMLLLNVLLGKSKY